MALVGSMAGAVFLAPGVARACSCMMQTQPDAFEQSASVFEGRVVSTEQPGDPAGDVTVLLDVVRRWKGADAEQVQVVTAENSAACGFNFEDGRSYLVYTNAALDEQGQPTGGLERVSLCSRTKRIEEAGEDLAAMGAGVTPVDPQPQPGEDVGGAPPPQTTQQAGCASCTVFSPQGSETAPLLGTALVLAAAVFRRRRR